MDLLVQNKTLRLDIIYTGKINMGKINSKKSERKLTDKALEETRNLLLQAIV